MLARFIKASIVSVEGVIIDICECSDLKRNLATDGWIITDSNSTALPSLTATTQLPRLRQRRHDGRDRPSSVDWQPAERPRRRVPQGQEDL